MQFSIFVIFCLFGIALAATTTCPENEYFSTCATPCPRTCQNTTTEPCLEVCLSGCVCKDGFIREGPGGKCVQEESCQDVPKCTENEEFTPCTRLCPPTCKKYLHPLLCSKRCISGCVCKKEYIRERLGGECIPVKECSDEHCGENEIFKECGSSCPATCSRQEERCDRKCNRGCFCKNGFVLDDKTKKCVSINNCPKN